MTDTTVLIWDHLFLCKIPQLDSTSVQFMRTVGHYITGDPGIDKELSNQWITTMLNIDRMVEFYREGVAIRVVNYSDTKLIYENISEHLSVWRQRLTYGLNIGNAPIEDLILMDEFANLVYDHAKFQFTREMAESILGKHLDGVTRLNTNNFFTKKPSASEDSKGLTANPIPDVPEREAHSSFLKERIYGLRNWRQ